MYSKVHYRPIEAAIRWSGLQRHEQQILTALNDKRLPEEIEFPRWPTLRLNTERIYDGIRNGELRYSLNGVAAPDGRRLDTEDVQSLTVRHVDLREWMLRYYPEQKPAFLFSRAEREGPPAIAIKLHIDALTGAETLGTIRKTTPARPAASGHHADSNLSSRSETTYLHIVGGLLSVLLGESPSGKPYSSFRTQEAIISAMVAHHGQRLGITERTLQAKFAAAKRAIARD